jgi:sialate O-acetylesterase
MKKTISIVLMILLVSSSQVSADIRLPNILSSNMVLQQQSTSRLWGWASPGEKILITTSWNNKTDSVKGTRDANWMINIQTPAAGGPYTITFSGNNQIVLENVMVGEVWICSGQSNMEWSYRQGIKDIATNYQPASIHKYDSFTSRNQLRIFHRIIVRENGLCVTRIRLKCLVQWAISSERS